MTTLSEGIYQSDWLKEYFSNDYNFANATMAQDADASDDIVEGTCLEGALSALVINVTGPTTCVLVTKVVKAADIAAGPVKVLVLVRGPAVIDSDNMIFPGSGQETDSLADLLALGIVDMPLKATWTTQTT